jgi:hypothetical protein
MPAYVVRPRGYPIAARFAAISSKIAGSSIVGGIVYATPSAIFLIVPRTILPERVFGSRLTGVAALKVVRQHTQRRIAKAALFVLPPDVSCIARRKSPTVRAAQAAGLGRAAPGHPHHPRSAMSAKLVARTAGSTTSLDPTIAGPWRNSWLRIPLIISETPSDAGQREAPS